MSWRASAWALDQVVGIGANAKLVLLALCEFANDDNETWRSQSEIAKRAECEIRTVKTHLKSLEGWGLISRRPRYRWCDSDEPACASRPAHKHRSGTTYVVHMEVGDFDLAALEADHDEILIDDKPALTGDGDTDNTGVDNLEANNEAVDNSTGAKLAPVEEVAESRGNVHRCNNCTCEADPVSPVSTGANSGSPQVQELAPIRSYNPHISLQPTNQPSDTRFLSEADSRMVGWMDDQPSQEDDVMLVRQCLPAAWQPIAVGTAAMPVARLIRSGIAAGWTPAGIERALAQSPTLEGATNPAGLMIYRVRKLVASPPPASAHELRKAKRQAREREIKTRLESILASPESVNPHQDWMYLGQLNTVGLSHQVRDLYEQAEEWVIQRQEAWITHQKTAT